MHGRAFCMLLLGSLLCIAACAGEPAAPPEPAAEPTTPPVATTPPETQPAAPETQPAPEPTPATPVASAEELAAELVALLTAELPPPEEGEHGTDEGIAVRVLENSLDERPLWVAHTQGLRIVPQNHFVALYTYDAARSAWQELGRVELEASDILRPEGVQQVDIVPERVWIEVVGGAGAHGSTYDLLSFDGSTFKQDVNAFHSSPVPGFLRDIDDDAIPEVALNQTDDYVICYACSIKEVDYSFLHWNGSALEPLALMALPASAPPDLSEVNNEAIAHAEVGLWKDAQRLAIEARTLNTPYQNPTVARNVGMIGLIAEERAAQVNAGIEPVLHNTFYGDYQAIIAYMSSFSVQALFTPPVNNPLIVGTPAESDPATMLERIQSETTPVLAFQPDLAAAYFVRGWASYLQNPDNPQAIADIRQATTLAAQEPVFLQSASYLGIGAAEDEVEAGQPPTPPQPGGQASDAEQAIAATAAAYTAGTDVADIVVETIVNGYARVAVVPTFGDGVLLFLEQDPQSETGWTVFYQTPQPVGNLDDLRAMDVPPELLAGVVELAPSEPATGPAASPEEQALIDTAAAYTAGTDVAEIFVEEVAGDYARVGVFPTFGDGVLLFLAQDPQSETGWVVIYQANLPVVNVDELRALGVPEALFDDFEDPGAAVPATPPQDAPQPVQPDGNLVLPSSLYFLQFIDSVNQIVRMEPDGLTTTQITGEASNIAGFDVSPLNAALAYVVQSADGSDYALNYSDAFGENSQGIFNGPVSSPLFFSDTAPPASSNERVAYQVFNPVPGLEIGSDVSEPGIFASSIEAPGRPGRLLTSEFAFQDSDPEFGARAFAPLRRSPDGTLLLLEIQIFPEQSGLAVYGLSSDPDQPAIPLSQPDGSLLPCCDASWSRDQQAIYVATFDFFGRDPTPIGLWRVDATTGVGELIAPGVQGDTVTLYASPYEAPDGHLYAFLAFPDRVPVVFENDPEPLYQMHRRTADGTWEPVRPDSYALSDVLWAEDGSGAVAQVFDPATGALSLLWLPSDGSAPVSLSIPDSGVSDLHWGQ